MFKFTGFTEKANKSLNKAVEAAQDLGHTYIGSEHLLLGLLSDTSTVAGAVLAARKLTYDQVENYIKQTVGVGVPTELVPDDFTPRSKNIIETAVSFARSMGQSLVGTEHVLLAIARESTCCAAQILMQAGISLQDLVNDISKNMMNGGAAGQSSGAGNPASDSDDVLSQFGRDLTQLARDGKIDPVIGRQKEIERVIQILSRRTKNNPCLIGEPGVGKTAIAEGLALKIVSGEVPEMLKNKRIISLDLTGMVAGTKYRGDFEERIKKVIDEVKAADDIILFIDEVHTLIGAGSAEGAVDAANIVKPSLARGELQVIGATTIEEYRKHIEKDSALERRFQPVSVEEPSLDDATEILMGIKSYYEDYHLVSISDEMCRKAVQLSERYITDRFLPDKAIDLIDEACSDLNLKNEMLSLAADLKTELKSVTLERESMMSDQTPDGEAMTTEELDNKYAKIAELRSKELQLENRLHEAEAAPRPVLTLDNLASVIELWTNIPASKVQAIWKTVLKQGLSVKMKLYTLSHRLYVEIVQVLALRKSLFHSCL